ncbi:hypothetical protein D3C86_2227690 [compost metagenome]
MVAQQVPDVRCIIFTQVGQDLFLLMLFQLRNDVCSVIIIQLLNNLGTLIRM